MAVLVNSGETPRGCAKILLWGRIFVCKAGFAESTFVCLICSVSVYIAERAREFCLRSKLTVKYCIFKMSSDGEDSESEANDTTEESSSEFLPSSDTCSDEDIVDERNESNEHSDNNDNNSSERADDTEGGVADNSLGSRGSGDTTNQNDENAGIVS